MAKDKKLQTRVYKGSFGTTEIAIVSLAGLFLAFSIIFYVFVTAPEESKLQKLQAERDQLQRELEAESQKYKNFTTTENQVTNLVKSAEDFEARFLPVADFGRTAIYQRLNYLIASHNLVNTSGPDYSPLEVRMQQSQTEERGKGRYQSLFPGVYITVTVEGSYQNLRRFIRDLEAGDQFLIITALELQPSESQGVKTEQVQQVQSEEVKEVNTNSAFVNQPYSRAGEVKFNTNQNVQPKGKVIGETVSLKVELVAYFRRSSQFLNSQVIK